MSDINKAVCNLYDSWDCIPVDSISFIKETMKSGNFEEAFKTISDEENRSKDLLIKFENNYPNVINSENANKILELLKSKKRIIKHNIHSYCILC